MERPQADACKLQVPAAAPRSLAPLRRPIAAPDRRGFPSLSQLWLAWQLRHRRRYLLLRGRRRARRELAVIQDNTAQIPPKAILLFCTFRNELERLPEFLRHYRALGVGHFFFIDNGSTDGSAELLKGAADVSLWHSQASYKASRFGMDWINGLLLRHGHGHWCLTVDADELLIYPYWQSRPLPALTDWLDGQEIRAFGAMMLDLYPKGSVAGHEGEGQTDLQWFDAGNYVQRRQPNLHNLWIQGGVRARSFFGPDPARAPTLGKVPLVRWHWRYTYVSSTHTLLPRQLNEVYDRDGGERISGVLLHSKFLPSIVARSAEEKHRQEHFANSALYDHYYDALTKAPDLWCPSSTQLTGWRQLEALGLMSRGGWV